MSATATVLILKTVNTNMTAHDGFLWPSTGPVEAPDWDPTPTCGGGLHGLLWGHGNASSLIEPDVVTGRWIVFAAELGDVVDIDGGKVKTPRGVVVHVGDRNSATTYLIEHGAPAGVHYATVVAGNGGTATAGYRGTAMAGESGTATAGDRGTATAGDRGTATAGKRGILTLRWWDEKTCRSRLTVAYVGEAGILPNVAYRCDSSGRMVPA